jgi:hypothetical protein
VLFTMTGFGLGWVNAAADYSRYLPRSASSRGVMWWTTFGSGLGPAVLLIFGLLIAGSSDKLNSAIAADPVGALATILPTWFLFPFIVVTVLGLVAGAVMDIYSSGLSLLNAGLRAPRFVAVSIDGTLMTIGAVYVVFFSQTFLGPFQGFLITLGVPIAAWCGVFVADIALRRRDYSERDLFSRHGRYGDVRWLPVALIVVATVLGWGLVTNTMASWLSWQGYLLGPLGLGGVNGGWAYANLGVIVALVLGFVGYLLFGRQAVRAQEALPVEGEVPLTNREAQDIDAESESVGCPSCPTPPERGRSTSINPGAVQSFSAISNSPGRSACRSASASSRHIKTCRSSICGGAGAQVIGRPAGVHIRCSRRPRTSGSGWGSSRSRRPRPAGSGAPSGGSGRIRPECSRPARPDRSRSVSVARSRMRRLSSGSATRSRLS